MTAENPVVNAYSQIAETYDDEGNVKSCWWQHTDKNVRAITLKESYRTVADIGCGTGAQLHELASRAPRSTRFFGVEPADNMRGRAEQLNGPLPNVRILAGAFEHIPLDDESIDFLYSINSFHWVRDPLTALNELQRVMRPGGEMEHFFIGRDIGREFIRATTPIFLKYMGPKALLEAARMRLQFTKDEAEEFFARKFGASRVHADEVYQTYYDTVEGHLGWWVRIEGQLLAIPPQKKEACHREIRTSLAGLDKGAGVPYTMHQLHVTVKL